MAGQKNNPARLPGAGYCSHGMRGSLVLTAALGAAYLIGFGLAFVWVIWRQLVWCCTGCLFVVAFVILKSLFLTE